MCTLQRVGNPTSACALRLGAHAPRHRAALGLALLLPYPQQTDTAPLPQRVGLVSVSVSVSVSLCVCSRSASRSAPARQGAGRTWMWGPRRAVECTSRRHITAGSRITGPPNREGAPLSSAEGTPHPRAPAPSHNPRPTETSESQTDQTDQTDQTEPKSRSGDRAVICASTGTTAAVAASPSPGGRGRVDQQPRFGPGSTPRICEKRR
jgi:hypothetical protein